MKSGYIRLNAILVSQPFGDFIVTSIKASKLVDLVYSFPAKYSESQLDGVQRGINLKRVENIERYCQTESPLFPSSIILAANIMDDGSLIDPRDGWFFNDGVLEIKTDTQVASIVDGQHRIEGIKRALKSGGPDFDLTCSIYMDLPAPKQAEVFATINFNQQKVDKSLAYQLFGYDLESSDPKYWSPDTLAISISRMLNKQVSSPFYNCISFGVKNECKGDLVVSTATMVEGISKLISSNPTADRYTLHKKRMIKKDRAVLDGLNCGVIIPPLRGKYLSFNDSYIYSVVSSYFSSVDSILWNKSPNTILKKTVGIQALFDLLSKILSMETKEVEKDQLSTFFNKELSKIDLEDIDDIENFSGAGRIAIRKKLFAMLDIS